MLATSSSPIVTARRVRSRAGRTCAAVAPRAEALESLTLKADGCEVEVYPFGACATSFKKDGRDILYVRPDAKFDGSKPISGGLPHCWPQFGPGEIQQHGFARNVPWEVTAQSEDSVTMTLLPSDYSKEMWDKEFKVDHTVAIKDGKLVATMDVTNTGDEAWTFTSSFHTYFSVEELGEVAVTGLEKCKALDRLADEESTQDGAVTITAETDSCYYAVTEPLTLAVGNGKEVSIEASGWTDAVVWNPWTGMEACYQEFVCVENACLDPVEVPAGETKSFVTTIG